MDTTRDTIRARRFRLLLAGILFLELALLVYANARWGPRHLDSDDSAEMILAELLSREGSVMSRNWYYSTEIRVLNTQLVMAPLFRVFSSWHTVRTVGTAILLILLEGSYLFLCASAEHGKKLALFAPVLLWPLSMWYYDIVLYGLYYIPHISITFCTLALFLRAGRNRRVSSFCALALLSFAAGLGGIRLPAICFAPLLAAALFLFLVHPEERQSRRAGLAAAALGAAASGAGYLVNRNVLLKYYSVGGNYTAAGIGFTVPSFRKLTSKLWEAMTVMGMKHPGFGSAEEILGILVFLMFLTLLLMTMRMIAHWRDLSYDARFLLVFYLFSLLVTLGIASCTSMFWSPRYFLLPCIGFVVVPAAYFSAFPLRGPLSRLLFLLIAVPLLLSGVKYHRTFAAENKLEYQTGAFEYILDSGMSFGFGDWDASDTLTELSDGRVHMCKLIDYKNADAWYWLMEKDFRKYADGPVFLLMGNGRLWFNGNIGHVHGSWTPMDLTYLQEGEVVFRDAYYTVWRYDSLAAFEEAAGKTF